MRHKITVRNVVLWNCGSPHHGSAGRLAPPSDRDKHGLSRCWPGYHRRGGIYELRRGGFMSYTGGIYELRKGDL